MLILLSVAEGVCLCLIGSSEQKYQKQSKQTCILQVICVQCVFSSGIDECGPQQHLNWPNCNLQICLHAVYSAAALSSIPTSAVHFRSSGKCLCVCSFNNKLRARVGLEVDFAGKLMWVVFPASVATSMMQFGLAVWKQVLHLRETEH